MAAEQTLQDARAAYQAPLHFYDKPARVADQYVVYLEPGHSLQQHKQRVNMDTLSAAIISVFNNGTPKRISYLAIMKADLLASVRGDPGVELVECDLEVYGDVST